MATQTHLDQLARDAGVRLFRLLKEERGGLFVVLIYSLGIGLASLAAPIGVQMLVNAIAFGGLVQPIIVLSILVLAALAFASVLRGAQAWVVERIQQRLFVRVASDLADRLPRASASALDDAHGPELVNRFLDVVTLQKGTAMLLLDGILVVLQIVVGGTLLALYHPALLAVAVILLLAILGILFGLGGGGAATSIAESKAKYALLGWFEELARHTTLFRGEGGSRFARTRSNELIQSYIAERSRHFDIVFRQTNAFLALQAIATAALLAVGGWLVLGGKLTLGQLVAAELILTSVVATFSKLGKYLEAYYDMVAAVDKLGALADLPTEREGRAVPPSNGDPVAVALHDVSFDYPDGRRVFRALRLSVSAGERVAVWGAHGSGKSTLADLLFGLREPAVGRVEIDGLPLRELSLPEYRQRTAIVREAAIFDGTLYENVSMYRPDVSLSAAKNALAAVGLWDEVANLPAGLETPLTTNGSNVATGFAQKVALARALAGAPRLLIVDGTLDGLAPSTRREVLGALLAASHPMTLVLMTHHPDIAGACERVLALPASAPLSEVA